MKRVMAVTTLIAALCMGCGSKETQLTMDNYKEYVTVKGYYEMSGKSYPAEQKETVYDSADFYASVESAPGYVFTDLTVTVHFDGKYYPWKNTGRQYGLAAGTYNEWIDETYVIVCDSSGSGEGGGTFNFLKPTVDLDGHHFNEIEFEVVDVSGKVKPAK